MHLIVYLSIFRKSHQKLLLFLKNFHLPTSEKHLFQIQLINRAKVEEIYFFIVLVKE